MSLLSDGLKKLSGEEYRLYRKSEAMRCCFHYCGWTKSCTKWYVTHPYLYTHVHIHIYIYTYIYIYTHSVSCISTRAGFSPYTVSLANHGKVSLASGFKVPKYALSFVHHIVRSVLFVFECFLAVLG